MLEIKDKHGNTIPAGSVVLANVADGYYGEPFRGTVHIAPPSKHPRSHNDPNRYRLKVGDRSYGVYAHQIELAE